MAENYDVKEWARETTRGRRVFNFNIRLTGKEIRGFALVKTVTMRSAPGLTETAYIWQSKASPNLEAFRINVTECDSWREAHESLRGLLLGSMHPDIPPGTRELATIGDVVYAGRRAADDMTKSIAFTRGNALISVNSGGSRDIDVSNVASLIDAALNDVPTTKDIDSGKVRRVKLAPVAGRANQAHTLVDNLPNTAPKGQWLKIIVPDGELGRRANALIYTPAETGEKRVESFILND